MEQRETQGTFRNFFLFLVLCFGILALNLRFNPLVQPPARPAGEEVAEGPDADQEAGEVEGEGVPGDAPEDSDKPDNQTDPGDQEEGDIPPPDVPKRVAPETRLVTLGSADPDSPYRMLATLTNQGAAVARVELNSPRFRDQEDRSGYLGHVVVHSTDQQQGCPVEVVGPGTPAARAGLLPEDVILAVDDWQVTSLSTLTAALLNTRPGQEVQLTISRDGQNKVLSAKLGRRPLEVVRPEGNDPLSFLLTLRQLGASRLENPVKDEDEKSKRSRKEIVPPDERLFRELDGLRLRSETWDISDPEKFEQPGPHTEVSFFRELPEFGLKVTKTYRLAKLPEDQQSNVDAKAYHLVFDVKIENIGSKARKVAYQLDGPTGLPLEGRWYARKVGRGWGGVGLRDAIFCWQGELPDLIGAAKIADDNWGSVWKDQEDQKLAFLGVDAQYFSAVMIPQKENPEETWFSESQPLRVGAVDPDMGKMSTNTSCRLSSTVHTLEPDGQPLEHTYEVFLGPKKPKLLAKYDGLDGLLMYGWFWWIAIPMLHTLHFFHDFVVFNYGLAIILLTILVRSCMYPLSRKQAMNMQAMQKLQPELKKIHEKYKGKTQELWEAQAALYRRHGTSQAKQMSGCLVVFLQLPIFIGLYRALMVDVELRGAPLISESLRWCSNLAAPDMLFDWSGFWISVGWGWFNDGQGILALGPYFNILPILTIVLFLIQQKMFMPPPADETAAMQQNVMKFMMIFMGLIFFKVASGLCIYFIASSIWGVAERKLLPKTTPPSGSDDSKDAKDKSAKQLQQAKSKQTRPQQRPQKRQEENKPAEGRLAQLKQIIKDGQLPSGSNDDKAGDKAAQKKEKKKRRKQRRSRGKG